MRVVFRDRFRLPFPLISRTENAVNREGVSRAYSRTAMTIASEAGVGNIDTSGSASLPCPSASTAMAAARGYEHPSILDGVSKALPALTRARKIQGRAARAGWTR